jgi:hypothetical protein
MDSSSCYTRITSSISTGSSIPFPFSFFFFIMEDTNFSMNSPFGRTYSSTTSLRDDDLVKGFFLLVLTIEGDEEKCSFLPFLVLSLVEEGTSSISSEGGGERSLCGEW